MLRNAQLVMPPIHRPEINVQWLHGNLEWESLVGLMNNYRKHTLKSLDKWWNGYMYEKEVIIDDFGPGGIDINHLLRWFDRYKCMVETKGGMCAFMHYIHCN